ncbi:hypothetical protein N7451_005689 [Penicillium sp. IBT 35674x]|nr:hypothetical protein N7451_005689 [Penicillium sp. IBT 35674x]
MDTQSQIRRYAIVKHLYQKFGNSMPWFFSSGDLQGLGIQVLHPDISDDGALQFDPCFFRPYPERVLQKWLLIIPPQTIPPLTARPDVTSMIQMEEETGIKNEAARATYKAAKKLYGPDEWEDHARQTHRYIDAHLECARIGLPEGYSLLSLGSIYCFRQGGNPERLSWRIHDTFEDCDESLPNPHAIITLTSDVPANNAKHCLTLHEMQAILGIMVVRTSHRPFCSHPLHPLLVLSYAGEKHGRIIQASLHGQHLVLQCSPLWSFADDKKAPVELFLRYMISQLVEVARWEKPNPAAHSLVDPIASMQLK